ncbi:unnamed protein product, partial [Discosporangium mesarthrocarpum]
MSFASFTSVGCGLHKKNHIAHGSRLPACWLKVSPGYLHQRSRRHLVFSYLQSLKPGDKGVTLLGLGKKMKTGWGMCTQVGVGYLFCNGWIKCCKMSDFNSLTPAIRLFSHTWPIDLVCCLHSTSSLSNHGSQRGEDEHRGCGMQAMHDKLLAVAGSSGSSCVTVLLKLLSL